MLLNSKNCKYIFSFDDQNLEKLRAAANDRGLETEVFYFDPKAFDWEDYLINIHIGGLVKYVFDWFYLSSSEVLK